MDLAGGWPAQRDQTVLRVQAAYLIHWTIFGTVAAQPVRFTGTIIHVGTAIGIIVVAADGVKGICAFCWSALDTDDAALTGCARKIADTVVPAPAAVVVIMKNIDLTAVVPTAVAIVESRFAGAFAI